MSVLLRVAGCQQAPVVRNELAVEFIPEERVDHYGNIAVSQPLDARST